MVSIKDVANACGVSVSTVSKALNNHKDVSESKKDYIKSVAKELGYAPNSSARALKTNKSHNIGVLFMDQAQSGLTHDYFANVLDAFKTTAEKNGYDITFIISNADGSSPMTYLEHCRFRGFDGIIIACVDFRDTEVQELMQSNFPVVIIDYIYSRTISILSDNMKGMKMLTQHAIDNGHRKIAYFYGEDSMVTADRLSGFYITMEENKIPVNDAYIKEAKYRNTELAEKLTLEVLAMDDKPTCILYPDDYSAFGGINAIRKLGLRIPEDISIAGFDGINLAMQLEPKLTTVVQNSRRIGECAAEKLISLIEHPRTTVIDQTVIDTELAVGKTISKI